MAESILFGVAERIIGRLATSAVQETVLLWGVNKELSGLEDTISLIIAVLVDAEEKKAHNHHVKAWLTRLEDAVHEVDDLLDDLLGLISEKSLFLSFEQPQESLSLPHSQS